MPNEPAKDDVPNEPSRPLPPLSRRHFLQVAGAAGVHLATGTGATASQIGLADAPPSGPKHGAGQADSEFALDVAEGAIVGLRQADDVLDTEWVESDERVGPAGPCAPPAHALGQPDPVHRAV